MKVNSSASLVSGAGEGEAGAAWTGGAGSRGMGRQTKAAALPKTAAGVPPRR